MSPPDVPEFVYAIGIIGLMIVWIYMILGRPGSTIEQRLDNILKSEDKEKGKKTI